MEINISKSIDTKDKDLSQTIWSVGRVYNIVCYLGVAPFAITSLSNCSSRARCLSKTDVIARTNVAGKVRKASAARGGPSVSEHVHATVLQFHEAGANHEAGKDTWDKNVKNTDLFLAARGADQRLASPEQP